MWSAFGLLEGERGVACTMKGMAFDNSYGVYPGVRMSHGESNYLRCDVESTVG